MIKIVFYKSKDYLTGFEASGHSELAEKGKDIVCAAVSGMTQMTVIELTEVQKLNFKTKRDDEKGYLFCKVSKTASEEDIVKAQNTLRALKISLKKIAKNYGKYIELEVKDEI